MDHGEVIPSLNEPWTMGGAKLMEWAAGAVAMGVYSELFLAKVGANMPVLLAVLLVTTFSMAALRRSFPDEERGLANAALTKVGICPPGIPPPAAIEPYWSGFPMRLLAEDTEFMHLDLWMLFPIGEDFDEEEDDDPYFGFEE